MSLLNYPKRVWETFCHSFFCSFALLLQKGCFTQILRAKKITKNTEAETDVQVTRCLLVEKLSFSNA
jgi:hypothetical protein